MIQSKQTFHFKPSIPIEGSWMVGLTDLEVYNSIFNITEEKIFLNFINFLTKRLVVFHTQRSEMRLEKTCELQILQQQVYKIIY